MTLLQLPSRQQDSIPLQTSFQVCNDCIMIIWNPNYEQSFYFLPHILFQIVVELRKLILAEKKKNQIVLLVG